MGHGANNPGRRKRSLPPQQAAEWIVRQLREAGYEALLAGGCVRDMLMNRVPKDYDVATSARPDELLRLFRRTLKVGVQFGVVMVGDAGGWIEVATFRSDVEYRDGRHPERVAFSDAQQDALRRDFTVNGLFFDPVEDKVVDYVGGQRDIRRRLIRAIGEPRERFAEDHLRLLRAVRFAAVLGFRIEQKTWQAVREHAPLLAKVSRERVLDELERMLASPGRATGMRLLADSGLLSCAIPAGGEGVAWPKERVERACARLTALPADAGFALALAAALVDWPSARAGKLCRQMAGSNQLRKAVVWLIESVPAAERAAGLSLAELKRLMASETFNDLERLLRAHLAAGHKAVRPWQVLRDRAAAIRPETVQPAPLVGGDDLKALGIPPGPVYKKVLDAVYTAQLNEQVTRREEALDMLRQLLCQDGYPV